MGILREKPLASALTLTLGLAGWGTAAASPPPNPYSDALRSLTSHYRQWRQQHGNLIFANVHRHPLRRAPGGSGMLQLVNTCVDNASSATTPGTLRYAVLNAADGDTIDLSTLSCSAITLTQGALPVTVDNLTVTGPSTGSFAIDGNNADRVFSHSGYGTLRLQHLVVRNGRLASTTGVASGGCISSRYGAVRLEYSTVSGCTVQSSNSVAAGGGVYAYQFSMLASTLTGNQAYAPIQFALGAGAAVYGSYYSYSAIQASTISGNLAHGQNAAGGGLYVSGVAYLQYSVVSNNQVRAEGANANYALGGGTVAIKGTRLTQSTVTGNRAVRGGACSTCFGGGMLGTKYGSVHIGYSTIDNNFSDGIGGGLFVVYSGGAITQSTISGNSAAGGVGGGVMVVAPSDAPPSSTNGPTLSIYNSTVAMNGAAQKGGGIYLLNGPSVTMVSTVVAKNSAKYTSDADIAANEVVTIAGSNDLVMHAATDVTLPSGTLTADPQLLPLANNGGPTRTHLPSPTSPVHDVGANPLGFDFDQRGNGFPRSVGGGPDIGAIEAAPAAPFVPAPAPTLSAWALTALTGLLAWLGLRQRRTRVVRRE